MKKTGHALFLTLLMVAGPSYSIALTVEPQKRALFNLDQGSLKKTPQQGGQQIIQGGITSPTPQQGEKSSPKEILAPRSSMMDYAKRAASAISSAIQWVFKSKCVMRNHAALLSSILLSHEMALLGWDLLQKYSDSAPDTINPNELEVRDLKLWSRLQAMGLACMVLISIYYMDTIDRYRDQLLGLKRDLPYLGATRDGLFLSDLNPEIVRDLETRIARLESKTGAISEDDKKWMASDLKNWVSISDTVYKTLIKNREKLPGLYTQYSQCLKAMYPKNQTFDACVKHGRFFNLRHHQEELDHTINWLNMQHDALRHTFDEITKKLDIWLDQPGFVSKWGLKEFKNTYDLKSSKIRAELVRSE